MLWKRKLLEVSAKASRQNEREAGVRGETRNECGAGEEAGGVTAAGARDKSRPVPAPLATLKRALARQEGRSRPGSQEMRDMGGGAFHGKAGLEVAPPSSEGPRRVLEGDWERRADAGSTWRTFPCTQQPQLAGIPFPRVLGRLELRQEIGRLKVDDLFGQDDLFGETWVLEPKSPRAKLLSFLLWAPGWVSSCRLKEAPRLSPPHKHLNCFPQTVFCSGLEEVETKVRLKKEKKKTERKSGFRKMRTNILKWCLERRGRRGPWGWGGLGL